MTRPFITPYRLSDKQRAILEQSGLQLQRLNEQQLFDLAQERRAAKALHTEDLLEFLQVFNALYRGGEPLISDAAYDFIFLDELHKRDPNHPYLQRVEVETGFGSKTEILPERMLSTDKAYSMEALLRWVRRIEKAAKTLLLDFHTLEFKVTPKLDGFAAYVTGNKLYTRGDGRRGTDISRVLERGLHIAGGPPKKSGAGEIVVSRSYFSQELSARFDNPRNFQASVIREKTLDAAVSKALKDQAVVFYPFSKLPSWMGHWAELQADFTNIIANIKTSLDYDVDGVVIEITETTLKNHMGATQHHHRWQIAYKSNLATARVEVLAVIPQTSRSGRITPVVEVPPTRLSGAVIQRVTAHHYGMVAEQGIGVGAFLEITRSGEVIPKIETVITTAKVDIPTQCPSCGDEVLWDSDYLICTNHLQCPAQITHTIEHFFRVLGNNDGFGKATVEQLFNHGIREIDAIFALKSADFIRMGFGPKQSTNLETQLLRSRREPIEDWRFLAAFGIYRLGTGNCEKLLNHYSLQELFQLNKEHLMAVEGFAEKTATSTLAGLKKITPLFNTLYQLGFHLQASNQNQASTFSPLAGKLLVFTGTMQHGTRTEMQSSAKQLGARIGNTVSSKTDYLITGENVGVRKINLAKGKGVQILTEQEYLSLIG